jgi:hypothetical protein
VNDLAGRLSDSLEELERLISWQASEIRRLEAENAILRGRTG